MSWTTDASVETNAPPETVWALWTDVENWPTWDQEVQHAKIQGPFATGTKGTLKPKGGPQSSFTMTDTVPFRSFTSRSKLPLTTLDFHHTLHVNGATTTVEHRVVMSGPLTFLFRRLIGTKIQRGLPHAVAELGRLASERR
jgi:Polyketide cyclase / dehydrase and lipid transport